MNAIIGAILVVIGGAIGLYVGVWWAFIGGIMDVIHEVRAVEMEAINVAIGVAKVVFAVPIGWASALALLVPGFALIQGE